MVLCTPRRYPGAGRARSHDSKTCKKNYHSAGLRATLRLKRYQSSITYILPLGSNVYGTLEIRQREAAPVVYLQVDVVTLTWDR